MSTQGIVIIDILGLGLILLIINLVRTHRLHVGYAIIWLLSVFSLMVIISVPPLLEFIPKAVGAIFPASALSLLAFVFIFLVLIIFSVQLSLISTRQIELAQAQALNDLLTQEQNAREERSSNTQDG